jgi:hypothetical protein
MSVATLLSKLKTLRAKVTVNDNSLRIRAPEGVLTTAH